MSYFFITKFTYRKLGLDSDGFEIVETTETEQDTIFTPIPTTPDVAGDVLTPIPTNTDVSSSVNGAAADGSKDANSLV